LQTKIHVREVNITIHNTKRETSECSMKYAKIGEALLQSLLPTEGSVDQQKGYH
jgi:hypothetical protein